MCLYFIVTIYLKSPYYIGVGNLQALYVKLYNGFLNFIKILDPIFLYSIKTVICYPIIFNKMDAQVILSLFKLECDVENNTSAV